MGFITVIHLKLILNIIQLIANETNKSSLGVLKF